MQVRANGLSLEVEDEGEGTPLLLIMGLGAQLLHWPQRFVDTLVRRGFRVVRFDNRDVGLSQRLSGTPDIPRLIGRRLLGLPIRSPYSLSDMAQDAVGVLDALDIDRAHIIGASLGGMIAQRVALEHPERALSLTSIMSSPGRRRDNLVSPKAALALLKTPDASTVESYTADLFTFMDTVGSPDFDRDNEEFRRVAAELYRRGVSPEGSKRQLAAILADGDRTELLRSIRKPTLVIHGLADPLIAPAGGRATAAAIPGARFMGIEGMGHDLPAAVHDRLADAIGELVQGNGSALAEGGSRA